MKWYKPLLQVELAELGFPVMEKMLQVIDYPEDFLSLFCREKLPEGRVQDQTVDFKITAICQKRCTSVIQHICATLHIPIPSISGSSYVLAELHFWKDIGPLPTKAEIIQSLIDFERRNKCSTSFKGALFHRSLDVF